MESSQWENWNHLFCRKASLPTGLHRQHRGAGQCTSNIVDVLKEAGTAYPSWPPGFIPGFWCMVHVARLLCFFSSFVYLRSVSFVWSCQCICIVHSWLSFRFSLMSDVSRAFLIEMSLSIHPYDVSFSHFPLFQNHFIYKVTNLTINVPLGLRVVKIEVLYLSEAIKNLRWLLWSLIGRDSFNFFSRTTGCEITKLTRNVPVSQKSNMATPASD